MVWTVLGASWVLAFLTVAFRIYSTLVVKLIVQEWGVCIHKMQVF